MQRLLSIIPVISLQIILKEEKQCVLFLPPYPTAFDERPKFDLLCKLSKTHFASHSVQTRYFLPSPLPWKKKTKKQITLKASLISQLRFDSQAPGALKLTRNNSADWTCGKRRSDELFPTGAHRMFTRVGRARGSPFELSMSHVFCMDLCLRRRCFSVHHEATRWCLNAPSTAQL